MLYSDRQSLDKDRISMGGVVFRVVANGKG